MQSEEENPQAGIGWKGLLWHPLLGGALLKVTYAVLQSGALPFPP